MKRVKFVNIQYKLKVPSLFVKGLDQYHSKWQEYKHTKDTITTSFTRKMMFGCAALGFMTGGYFGGKHAWPGSVTEETLAGCVFGTLGGFFCGMLWPALPFIPIPYVMYKTVRVFVDKKRRER
jgi:hypothetical protein